MSLAVVCSLLTGIRSSVTALQTNSSMLSMRPAGMGGAEKGHSDKQGALGRKKRICCQAAS